ncbi:hypothetical protein, partial [Neisseria meningitidis]|uniref:hypothetical protein n=1 Tax=Neisseria meningitidis TaxID=487 RepID=UPI001E453F56
RHSRAGGNLGLSVRKLIGKAVSLDFAFWIPTFVGMTNFRFLILVFCFCRNDEILSFRNLSEKTETAPPSFPRRRESRLVGADAYRIKRFLEIPRPGFPLSRE